MPESNFYHEDFYERSPLSRAMRQAYIHKYAPMREIGQYMNREHPGAPILLAEGTAHRRVQFRGLCERLASVCQLGPHAACTHSSGTLGHPDRVERALCGRSQAALWICDPAPDLAGDSQRMRHARVSVHRLLFSADRRGMPASRSLEAPPLPVQPGAYDDLDPAFVYDGPWIRDTGWDKAQFTPSLIPTCRVRS